MPQFKVGDVVRVKPKETVAPGYHYKIGPIAMIDPKLNHPYIVYMPGGPAAFEEDELEKI